MKILRILLDKYEVVQDTMNSGDNGLSSVDRFRRYREGQVKLQKILQQAVRVGQLPRDHDVRLGAIAIMSFIDGLSTNCIMSPGSMDIDTQIPLLLDCLFSMLNYGCRTRE